MRVWITLGLIAIAVGCSGKHEGPHAAKAPGMKMPTQRKLVVETEPAQPQTSSPTKLVLQIPDDDGLPIKQFDVLHTKLVHLIVVREGLDEFAHLHPEVDASGTITVD